MAKSHLSESYLNILDLNRLRTELEWRIDKEEQSTRKIERTYPYWGISDEAKTLEGLIRGFYILKPGSENQLRCSIRAFDEWKAGKQDRNPVVEPEIRDGRKKDIFINLKSEIQRIKEKYSIIDEHLGKDESGKSYFIFAREKNAVIPMTDQEIEAVISHIMRLDKLCVELQHDPMSEKKFNMRITDIINKAFYSGGLKTFPGEKEGGKEIVNLNKLVRIQGGERKENEIETTARVDEAEALFIVKQREEDYKKIMSKDYGMLKSEVGPLKEKLKYDWLDGMKTQPASRRVVALENILIKFLQAVEKLELEAGIDVMNEPVRSANKVKIIDLLKDEMKAIGERYDLFTTSDNENLLFFDKNGKAINAEQQNKPITIIIKRLQDIDRVIQGLEKDQHNRITKMEMHSILLELKDKMIPTNPGWLTSQRVGSKAAIDKAIEVLAVKDQVSKQVMQGMKRSTSSIGEGMKRSGSGLKLGGK